MHRVRLFSALSAAVLLLAISASGCGGDSKQASGEVFRYGFAQELDSTNPFVAQTLPGIAIRTQIYPQLVQYDKDFKLIGDFAKSWNVAPDGKTWTFKTHPGAKWSDGTPLTAKDAAWTFTTIENNRKGGAAQLANQIPTPITRATATSDDELVIEFGQRAASALGELQNIPILPKHIWAKHATGADGAGLKTFANAPPVVSGGPLKLDKNTKGQSTLFGANPGYYGPKPHVGALGFRYYASTDAMIAALKGGEIDGAQSVPPTALSAIENDDKLKINESQGLQELLVEVNVNPERTKHREILDPKVREAMALAVDRDQLNEVVYGGKAEPAGSVILPVTGEWYDKAIEPPPFDVDKANQILDDAGYERGADGIRLADGKPMSYVMLTSPGMPSGEGRVADIMKEGFSKAGMKLTQRSLDINAFITALGDPDNTWTGYDFALVASSFPMDPDQNLISFITEQQPEDGGFNWTSYESPEFDRLYEQQRVEMDVDKRRELVYQAQQLLYEDNPVLMLVYEPQIDARSTGWSGFVESPTGPISQFNKLTVERLKRD